MTGPDVAYDRRRFRTLLEALLADRGTVHWRDQPDDRSTALLLPSDPSTGEPVLVTMVDDEAVVWTGFGGRVLLTATEHGEEDQVIRYLAAVLDGGATEYASFDGDRPPYFRTRLVVDGPWGSPPPTADALHVRNLPAWPRDQRKSGGRPR